jgi:DNA-binding GntR family transcriptional regulator
MLGETLPAQIAARIVNYARANRLPAGEHLGAQHLADLFKVSRIPIRAALLLLAEEGFIYSERNRGFFLAVDAADWPERMTQCQEATTPWDDPLYYRLAEDWLVGKLDERVSENELMRRYEVKRHRLHKVLQRAAEDFWIERLPGHGWRFLAVMASQQAYEDGYRLRLAIEPAALLEPTYRIDKVALATISEQQFFLLKGGFRKLSQAELFSLNAQFHEVLIGFSNNPFFVDALKKINRVRRLLDFRSTNMNSRDRLLKQCNDHIEVVGLLESGDNKAASEFLYNHIQSALESKRALIANVMPLS